MAHHRYDDDGIRLPVSALQDAPRATMLRRLLVILHIIIRPGPTKGMRGQAAKPPAAHHAPAGPARYPDAASLVTALARHGDTCPGASYTGSEMATCQGSPTTVLTFSSARATHANLVKTGQAMIALATAMGKTSPS